MSYLDAVRDFVKTTEDDENPLLIEQLYDIVIELHSKGKFSEGYVAAILGIDRLEVRELKNGMEEI